MKMRIALTLALTLTGIVVVPALAHRPYFEEQDIESDAPLLDSGSCTNASTYL